MSSRLAMGNTAVVVGALYAGCECFFGYPITPASEIAHDAARYFPRAGRTFLQAESETAAVNMLYGAACTGRRAMTASSGPGISLMQEGLSYMAGADLPCVVVDIVRAGPGLGNIGPEQGDYNQVVKGGGHGNYRLIVLAPASVQEMCDDTIRAFDLAETYRMPVIVLADGVLGQMVEPLHFPDTSGVPCPDPSWAVMGTAATRRNLVTSIYLDFDEMEAMNERLQARYAQITALEAEAETYLTEDAELVVVGYGISSRIARTVVDRGRARGQALGLVRLRTLWPFPRETFSRLLTASARRFLVVEMSNGQLTDDVRLYTECRLPVDRVSRLGGNLITVENVESKVAELLASA